VRRRGPLCWGVVAALIVVSAVGATGCGAAKSTSASSSPVTFTSSSPGEPPAWIQNLARSLAAGSGSPKPTSCEWILTTFKKAAPVVGLAANDPSVKAHADVMVYVIIEHGLFDSSKVGAVSGGSSPRPAPWYVSALDAQYKAPVRVGLLPSRPDTSSVGKMHVFTF
jgi:hypothetical protein